MTKNALVQFWQEFKPIGPPYLHPQDEPLLRGQASLPHNQVLETGTDRLKNATPKTKQENDTLKNRLELSLPPIPFQGDLSSADIFVLLLNPGFENQSIDEHAAFPNYADCELSTLQTGRSSEDFPFHCLNPKFSMTGGYRWWEGKLRATVTNYAETNSLSYFDALQHLSKRLAAIEMYPYRSQSFKGTAEMKKLPSRKAALSFVHETLVPRCNAGECELIVTRRVSEWGFKEAGGKAVTYSGGEARGASLSPTSRGGKAILNRLNKP